MYVVCIDVDTSNALMSEYSKRMAVKDTTINDIISIVFIAICSISKNDIFFVDDMWFIGDVVVPSRWQKYWTAHRKWEIKRIKTIWPSRVSNGRRISALPTKAIQSK